MSLLKRLPVCKLRITLKDGHDLLLQIKAEKHHEDESVEDMQAHTVKTVKILHHGEEDDEEPHPPKKVPQRAKN